MVQEFKKGEKKAEIPKSPIGIYPSPPNFKNALTTTSIKDRSFVENQIKKMEDEAKKANRELQGIKKKYGLVDFIPEKDLNEMFLTLREEYKKVKTKEDEKNFFIKYWQIARLTNDLVSAVNDFHAGIEKVMTAAEWITGVNSDSAKNASSRIWGAVLLYSSIGSASVKVGAKAIQTELKVVKIAKYSPEAEKAITNIIKIVEKTEATLKAELQKEIDVLSRIAIRARQIGTEFEKVLAFRSSKEIKNIYSNLNILEISRLKTPHERGVAMLKTLIDDASRSNLTAHQERVLMHLESTYAAGKNFSTAMKQFAKEFVESGGTLKDLEFVADQIQRRGSCLRGIIGNKAMQAKGNRALKNMIEGLKDLQNLDLYTQALKSEVKSEVERHFH